MHRAQGQKKFWRGRLGYHRPCCANNKAVVTQCDYTNTDGNLIAPGELYSTLNGGTPVLVYVATYVMKDFKHNRGDMQVDRKLLRTFNLTVVMGSHGPPIPTMPEHRTYLPRASPRKRARDSVTDAVFSSATRKS
ncbi:hypothetical protein C8F04DRAFT_1198337 [Mycena alexandri]|uniref:Uncharacterized protein n=1 Tax=Mycena alexandri TaxID=1745969 RepID=A0AAD6S4Q8_9AGAR|nr:hypothetical protein C8F04DRAFT_1198337 [Mycena alexandri]